MSEPPPDIDWSLTTWEGSRRAQLRRALELTLRERLAAAEGLADIARRFAELRAQGAFSEPAAPGRVLANELTANSVNRLPSYFQESLAGLSARGLLDLLLADEDRAPRNLIDECARRGDEMVQVLAELVERDDYWQDGATGGEWWLLVHAPMILGLMQTEPAGLLLVRLMRRMDASDDDDLQDWVAECWPELFREKPRSLEPALTSLAEDEHVDWYMRIQAVDSVVAMAGRDGVQALDAALDWVAGMAAAEDEEWDLRLSCGSTLLDFARERHRALVENLAEEQAQDGFGMYFSAKDVARAFARGKDEPGWSPDPWSFYEPEAIAERQERWARERAWASEERPAAVAPETTPGTRTTWGTYVRETPKVGRNAPCPCGSGKKYKKCCLPGAAS